jgi:hypothetical protein
VARNNFSRNIDTRKTRRQNAAGVEPKDRREDVEIIRRMTMRRKE